MTMKGTRGQEDEKTRGQENKKTSWQNANIKEKNWLQTSQPQPALRKVF
jgi:hypothetical protein